MDERRYVQMVTRRLARFGQTPPGRFVAVGRDILHYQSAGPEPGADGPVPLVLLHGLAAWSNTWRHNLQPLAAHGPVLAPDLRGFGLSNRPPTGYGLWDQATLVEGLLDALGVRRAVLVGWSMGGEVAMRLALRAPERVAGLVLVCSAGLIDARLPGVVRLALRLPAPGAALVRLAFFNRRFAQAALATGYGHPGTPVDPAVCDGYLLPGCLPGAARSLLRVLGEADFGATAADLPRIRQPALVLWGSRDPWIPLNIGERLARTLPAASLHIFPAAGHLPHEQDPVAFNTRVLDWLQSLTPRLDR